MDGNNVPLSDWYYKQIFTNFPLSYYPPYVERLRQVEIDKTGCNEYKWENPGIETKLIDPFGLGNTIRFRMKDTLKKPVNFRIDFNDGTGWYGVNDGTTISSDNPNFKVETEVYNPHNKDDLFRETVAGDVNYNKDKIKIQEWQIPHIGEVECKLNDKTYPACLPQGTYMYRVRAEDSKTGYPLTDYYYTDWIRLDYKYWYLLSDNEDDKNLVNDLENNVDDVYMKLDDYIRSDPKFKAKIERIDSLSNAESVRTERFLLFQSKKQKFWRMKFFSHKQRLDPKQSKNLKMQ